MAKALSANPNYYDYLHYLTFDEDGSVNICDGGGQSISFKGEGKYELVFDEDMKSGTLFLRNVYPVNWLTQEKGKKCDDLEVKFTVEEGEYKLVQGRIWGIRSAFDEEYMIYNKRYVFEFDPIAAIPECGEGRKQTLFFLIKNLDEQKERIYYERGEDETTVKWSDWLAQGNELHDNVLFGYVPSRNVSDPIEEYIFDVTGNDGAVQTWTAWKEEQSYDRSKELFCFFNKKGECIGVAMVKTKELMAGSGKDRKYLKLAELVQYKIKEGHEDLENSFLEKLTNFLIRFARSHYI